MDPRPWRFFLLLGSFVMLTSILTRRNTMRPIRFYAVLAVFASLLLVTPSTAEGVHLSFPISSANAQDDALPAAEPAEAATDAQPTSESAEAATDSPEATESATEPAEATTDESAATATSEDATPKTPDEAVEAVTSLMNAYDTSNWTLVFAFAVMILVYALRVTGLLEKVGLSSKALTWISLGVGLLTGLASALIAGLPWPAAIMEGVLIGLAGSGLWSAVGKQVLPTGTKSASDSTGDSTT